MYNPFVMNWLAFTIFRALNNVKMKQNLLRVVLAAMFFTGCDTDNLATQSTNAIAGNYVITSLQANIAVDLDNNGSSSTNILSEATCVQQMNVTFNADGSFTAVVADVSYDANNLLVCTTATETGVYTYVNGMLTITVSVNGGTVSESQAVVLTTTTFSFTFNSARINQAFPDLGTTAAAGITDLDVVYTRI